MKITDITLTLQKTGKYLLRIQTDAGVEGWAEARLEIYSTNVRHVFAAYLEAAIKPVLVGENPLGIDHFEEPIPHWDLPGLREVTDALDVTVSAGEQDSFHWWFQNLVALGNPDILQPDILNADGPSEVKRIFDYATALDKSVMPHSPQNGINSMASLQVYATTLNANRPHEFSTEFSGPLEDVAELYGEHVVPKDGKIVLTDRPGLGIDLNEAAVQRMKA